MSGAVVVPFQRPRAPVRSCPKCSGRGWYSVTYMVPGSATAQSTVRVCDCIGIQFPRSTDSV